MHYQPLVLPLERGGSSVVVRGLAGYEESKGFSGFTVKLENSAGESP